MHKTPVVCYDLRSRFARPPDLKHCPACGQELQRRSAHPSAAARAFAMQASIPMVETALLSCTVCSWWAIREISSDCELNDGCTDLLLVPRRRTSRPAAQPWEQALEDEPVWQDSHPLTRYQALRLFGLSGWPKPAGHTHSK